jgi:Mg2+-importing ATPase
MKTDFWGYSIEEALEQVDSRPEGLSFLDAKRRFSLHRKTSLFPAQMWGRAKLLVAQFKSPLILLLLSAAILSFFLGGRLDASLILVIVFGSALLGYWQEKGAAHALRELLKKVETKSTVLREGKEFSVPLKEIVPGDVVLLNAGDLVPGDCLLLEAEHLFVDEATFTGESVPAEKEVGLCAREAPIGERHNALFLGTLIVSGFAKALVMQIGKETLFGALASHLPFRPPETAFETGVRKLGYFLLEITLILVIAIFAINLYFARPLLEALLFALALAVGLTPQLLPAIISVNLSHGAKRMAAKKVIVKRLTSIENFGQMDLLCVDKTGTVTTGVVELLSAVDGEGKESEEVLEFASLNAFFQKGYTHPFDQALLKKGVPLERGWKKVEELPYDFLRKRVSVVLEREGKTVLIMKGAVPQVLDCCEGVKRPVLDEMFREALEKGCRTLAVAIGNRAEEKSLRFLGFLHFSDPVRPGIAEVVARLKKKGVGLKIITGDHHWAALHVAKGLLLSDSRLTTGAEIKQAGEAALLHLVEESDIFAEVEPNEKERIVLALRKRGHVVGYLGDGINDIAALHSADVGIAVEGGADGAKEAADLVLLQKDLSVLEAGIEEGRRTFVNTIKYVYMATSANFGNMFSMAGASLFLPFLPLLPKQVLLTNLLTDLPEMGIASDLVDVERVERPVQWELPTIRKFMWVFGTLSSFFDFLCFGFLYFWIGAGEELFRTGWFIESVSSAAFVALPIRTQHSMFRSRPSPLLGFAIVMVGLGVFALPWTPLGPLFSLTKPSLALCGAILLIVVLYLGSVEGVKRWFFKKRLRKE